MVKRIIWSRNAIHDRIKILDYWNKRIGTKTYSKKLEKSFRKSVNHLLKYPEIGRKLNESELRYLIKDHYQIFYKIHDEEIRILHIWDSRRNPDDFKISN
jgi:plasmid stabilization system protein ParE